MSDTPPDYEHVRKNVARIRKSLHFDSRTIPPAVNEYVAWIDLMGARHVMSVSAAKSANYLARLHMAADIAVASCPHPVRINPINDGVFNSDAVQERGDERRTASPLPSQRILHFEVRPAGPLFSPFLNRLPTGLSRRRARDRAFKGKADKASGCNIEWQALAREAAALENRNAACGKRFALDWQHLSE